VSLPQTHAIVYRLGGGGDQRAQVLEAGGAPACPEAMKFPVVTVTAGIILIVAIAAVTSLDWTHSILNPSNYRLLTLSRSEQARELSHAVGQGCRGVETFYMGMPSQGFAVGAAFWSLRCQDGRTFAILINPDSDGTSLTVSCSALAQYTQAACFRRFKAR
jgi:hypothetical protein